FDTNAVDPHDCVESARRFDVQVFKRTLPREVQRAVARARAGEREQRPHAPVERPAAAPRHIARGGLARIS
ncbi:MAG: hypothetical protein QOJ12_1041, partial [Thermoleophilales bacterium]|nr:hypothetical protein [Thermoleophilales bacterium]